MQFFRSKKTLYLVLLPFCIVFFAIVPRPSQLFAQSANRVDLSASPIFFEYRTNPGETISDKIRIRNNGDQTLQLSVEIKRVTPGGEKTDATIDDLKPEDQFAQWITLKQMSFTAPPREWVEIPYSVKVPSTAAFGYYWAFLVKQDAAIQNPSNPTEKIIGSVAIPVLMTVKKEGAKAEGQLVEFKTNAYINEYQPIEFTTRVSNTGNVHIKPRGNIFIRGSNDKDLAILEVNEGMGNILPGGTRSFTSNWVDGFLVRQVVTEDGKVIQDSKGNPKTELAINWNKLTDIRMGKYTASLLMVYDDGKRDVPLEATTTFWVIPYTLIGGIVIGFIVFILVTRFFLRSYIRSQMRKQR